MQQFNNTQQMLQILEDQNTNNYQCKALKNYFQLHQNTSSKQDNSVEFASNPSLDNDRIRVKSIIIFQKFKIIIKLMEFLNKNYKILQEKQIIIQHVAKNKTLVLSEIFERLNKCDETIIKNQLLTQQHQEQMNQVKSQILQSQQSELESVIFRMNRLEQQVTQDQLLIEQLKSEIKESRSNLFKLNQMEQQSEQLQEQIIQLFNQFKAQSTKYDLKLSLANIDLHEIQDSQKEPNATNNFFSQEKVIKDDIKNESCILTLSEEIIKQKRQLHDINSMVKKLSISYVQQNQNQNEYLVTTAMLSLIQNQSQILIKLKEDQVHTQKLSQISQYKIENKKSRQQQKISQTYQSEINSNNQIQNNKFRQQQVIPQTKKNSSMKLQAQLLQKKTQSNSLNQSTKFPSPKSNQQKKQIQALRNEQAFTRKYVKLGKYTIVRMQRDGNCFYEALSQAVFKGSKDQITIRKEIQQYFVQNKQKYLNFLDSNEGLQFEDLIVKNNEYANQLIYQIAADFLQTHILIYRNRFSVSIPGDTYSYTHGTQRLRVDHLPRYVKLLFTGQFDRGHFDLIIGENDSPDINQNSEVQVIMQDSQLSKNDVKTLDQEKRSPKLSNPTKISLPSSNEEKLESTVQMLEFFCGCAPLKKFKNFYSLRSHYYSKHSKVPPKQSPHDINGLPTGSNEQNGSSIFK